jgi:S-adenosylmethionine:tRNA-ribosyltransferase-isomerase (queuine synthetase)
MEKTFSKIEISVIKSAAKNAAPYVSKKQKLEAQIKEVEEKVAEQIRKRADEKIEKIKLEMAGYQSIIDSLNASVKQITGGYTTEDLIDIKKEATGSMDPKTGKEIFKTVYALKYPETVVPPTTEGAGSDFDIDEEKECPTHEAAGEEMPEEMMQEQAQVAEEAENADPFGEDNGDPFNQ